MSNLGITLHFHSIAQLNDGGTDDILLHNSNIEFDADSLSLTFSASLEYVGLSAEGNYDDEYNLGTMSTRTVSVRDVFLLTVNPLLMMDQHGDMHSLFIFQEQRTGSTSRPFPVPRTGSMLREPAGTERMWITAGWYLMNIGVLRRIRTI